MRGLAIKHFMWAYQHVFRTCFESAVTRVLGRLDSDLHPSAFLVGVRAPDASMGLPACVEPEKDHWASSEAFYTVLDDVPSLMSAQEDAALLHSDSTIGDRHQERRLRRAIRDAVLIRLRNCKSLPADTKVFLSPAVRRGDYYVFCVVEINASRLAEFPAVHSADYRISPIRTVPAPRSLVEATIDELFASAARALSLPDAGFDWPVIDNESMLLHMAARRFFCGLLRRVDEHAQIAGVAEMIFDDVVRIALTPYEGEDARGSMLFAGKEVATDLTAIRIATPLDASDTRLMRKLLLASNNSAPLVCSGQHVLGLVHPCGDAVSLPDNCLVVGFEGRGRWLCTAERKVLMVVQDGIPARPKPSLDPAVTVRDLRRLFPAMSADNASLFAQKLVDLASDKHGSLIILAEDAAAEAQRLEHDGCRVAPFSIFSSSGEWLARIAKIDGALLCDLQGVCHAFGVILDGTSRPDAARARGSRYNSAHRYIHAATSGISRAAVVVSEDGSAELLPHLRPPLSMRLLNTRLDECAHQILQEQDDDPRRAAQLIGWLHEHAFYLTEEQCCLVNKVTEALELRHRDGTAVRVKYSSLCPHPEFKPTRDLCD